MLRRVCMPVLLSIGLAMFVAGCGSSTEVDSITISPTEDTLGPNATVQLTAIGTIGHGQHPAGHQDITSIATWSSSIPGVASVSASGLVTGHNAGVTAITASIQGFGGLITSNTATVTVVNPAGPLISLAVDPVSQGANAIGQTAQFLAIASETSGATVDVTNQSKWTSSDPAVATINASTGLATAVGAGTSTITAVAANPNGSVVSGTATYTVTISGSPEPLVSLAIVPSTQSASAVGQTAQYIAIGTTGSGTTVNLTNQSATINGATVKAAKWTSSNAAAATVDSATGLATAKGAGTSAITAIATNPDGSVVTGTATFTVTIPTAPEPLVSLAIVPGSQAGTAVGQTAQYIAIGTTASGTTVNLTNQSATYNGATIKAAKWTSSNSSTATIDPATGLATAAGAGVTAIAAIASNPDGSVVTGTATYTVTLPATPEPLTSLTIIPGTQTATVAKQTSQFIVIGVTSAGTTVNLTNKSATIGKDTIKAATWASSATSVATIDANTGLATALNTGVTAITAIASNPDGSVVTGTATFNVTTSGNAEPLLSLAILPGTQSLASPGETSQLLAIGTFSAAPTTQDLTSNNTTYPIRWGSSDSSVATVGSPKIAGTTPGLVTAVGAGQASITAYAANPDGTLVYALATFTVVGQKSEPFTGINVVPATLSLSASGQTGQFIAVGTAGGTGLDEDVTNSPQVTWSSSISTVATVSTYPQSPAGKITGVSAGQTTITAKLTNPDGSVSTSTAVVTVTTTAAPEPLLSLQIIPNNVSVGNLLDTGQYLAYGTFSTAPAVRDLTNSPDLTWISSAPNIFPINTTGIPGQQAGVITADGSGLAVVIAQAKNPDGSLVTATATFTCPLILPNPPTTAGSCYPGSEAPSLLATLTVFATGGDTSDWLITAPSATGTQDVIHCGPGSAGAGFGDPVCEASYPIGTTVTVTAPAGKAKFGGWSDNCANVGTISATGPNSCTVVLSTNDSVGAIFN